MLHINNLIYRIEGKLIFDGATAAIASGHKVGLVGRNGAGKTTLLRLIGGEIAPDDGAISTSRKNRIGAVAQEAPSGPESLVDTVLAADLERHALLHEAETAADPGRISDIQIRLSDIDAHTAPARAAAILAGLGFNEAEQQRPCREFSGGWRMRVALGAALFAAPEILLLDEPTNYLDLEGTLWLENFVARYPHTCLIVSHDRDLLNRSVNAIMHLTNGKLSLYTGGYDDFEEQRRETQRLQLKLMKKQDDTRRHMEAFVERFRYKATKARQAQSRLKALQKLQPIAAEIEQQVTPIRIPNPKKQLGNPMLRLEDASVGYEPGKAVLAGLTLRIDEDDRIGLLGRNGNGKSTFAKLISGRLLPMTGHRRCSKKLTFGYFAQHQLDELDENRTPYDYIAERMEGSTEAKKRARLGALGYSYDKADVKCVNLSGGEKARLLLALATFDGPNLLILDEPTNHLDVDSRESLIHALNTFEGAVILITHDRHLIETTTDRLWITRDGTITPYDGDLDDYRAMCLSERPGRAGRRAPANGDARPSKASRAEQRRLAAKQRAEMGPLRKDLAAREKEIARITKEVERLDIVLGDADLYDSNPAKASELAIERGQVAKRLADAEEAWLALSERLEGGK